MSLLKNQAALQVVATSHSLLARLGPVEPNQIGEAVATYKALYNQHAQLLATTVVIAGPSLNAVGSTPVAPNAIRTYSWCFTDRDPNHYSHFFPEPKTGDTPSSSNYAWTADNAGDNPTFWSDWWIQPPNSGVGPSHPRYGGWNKGADPVTVTQPWDRLDRLVSDGVIARSLETKFEMIIGHGANQKRFETTWGVFVTTIALPLLQTYQTVLRNLADRLKATHIPDVNERKEVWTMLLSCSAEVTEFTLDKLEVLRDPSGSPIYLPPASVSAIRDEMMNAVIDSYRAIQPSARFEV